ncbi:CBS domain-containing protein [Yinghuangia seranimata]|uniref:CBS domain-containing protein n=1 Tax=Yinghuangia seranimata TaxID=408067 RepID=UPI00248C78BE|nr:CBS domain-containing protein [Yinghuangia seranimata]MDI2125454.1 CBS domain-containing protein [Yinghuangia seranimata]
MQHQRVENLMTEPVVTVQTDTPFKEIVRVLREHAVSATPVLDQDKAVVGVVSEADLLRKEADSEGPARLPVAVHSRRAVREARGKAEGETAGELMTAPAVVVGPGATVGEAARLMERHGVKRLPVVDASGRLRGIVSRCDLLRVYLRPDEAIRAEIRDDLLRRDLWVDPDSLDVRVLDGVVTLAGEMENKTLTSLLVRMVRGVDGVVQVHDRLAFAVDDTKLRPGDAPRPGRRL